MPASSLQEKPDQIRADACLDCIVCGAKGDLLYSNVKDRYFGAPGDWNTRKCSSSSCGVAWLDPMPAKEDLHKAYERYYTHTDTGNSLTGASFRARLKQSIRAGYISHRYGYNNGGHRLLGLLAYLFPFRRAAIDFDVMYLPPLPGGRLLEIGCGSGIMLRLMKELGWEVEGVDFDPDATKNAERLGIKVQCGCLENLNYKEESVDAITMSHVIEHVHEPEELLRECHRILRPGGSLSIVTPNAGSLGHGLFGASWFHLDPPRHLHLLTVNSLSSLLRRVGFHDLKVGTTIRGAAQAHVGSRSIRRTGRYEWGSMGTVSDQCWAGAIQIYQYLLLSIGRPMGEELTALVQK